MQLHGIPGDHNLSYRSVVKKTNSYIRHFISVGLLQSKKNAVLHRSALRHRTLERNCERTFVPDRPASSSGWFFALMYLLENIPRPFCASILDNCCDDHEAQRNVARDVAHCRPVYACSEWMNKGA